MTDSNQSTDDAATDARPVDAKQVTRRNVLTGVGTGAAGLLLGSTATGTATAKGKGGKAAVPVEELPEDTRAFYFDEPTGKVDRKTCASGGNGIVLAEWTFYYDGEDPAETDRRIFTRDNAIDTSVRYTISDPGTIDCGEFVLATYSPAGSP